MEVKLKVHMNTEKGPSAPEKLLWGSQDDYHPRKIQIDTWTEVKVSFNGAGQLSINFFAHHNNGCEEKLQHIHLDTVETRQGSFQFLVSGPWQSHLSFMIFT